MTQTDFLAALAAVAAQYTWVVDEDSRALRGYPGRPAADQICYCPLTALAHSVTGEPYDNTDWEDAAQALGVPLREASDLVGAADDDGSAPDTLRAALLQAVGLG